MPDETNPLLEPLTNPREYKQWSMSYEKPWYRIAVGMAAQGFKPSEIAPLVGKHRISVERVLKQPEERDRTIRVISNNVVGEIKQLIEENAVASLSRLADLAASEELRAKRPEIYERVNQSFLDRYLGKAPQVVENRTAPSEMTDEEQERRLAELRARAIEPQPN